MQSQTSDEWVVSHPARKKPLGHTKRKNPVNRKDTTSHNIHNFEPCDHPGEACGPTCACVVRGNYCEKFCACGNDCRNRFAGCNCKGQCNTKRMLEKMDRPYFLENFFLEFFVLVYAGRYRCIIYQYFSLSLSPC